MVDHASVLGTLRFCIATDESIQRTHHADYPLNRLNALDLLRNFIDKHRSSASQTVLEPVAEHVALKMCISLFILLVCQRRTVS